MEGKWCLRCSLLFLSCVALSQAAKKASQTNSDSAGDTSYCFRATLAEYNAGFEEAFQFKLGENVTIYTNCLSFGQNRELNTAVVSGRNESGATEVFEFVCRGNALLAFDSARSFSNRSSQACVDCSITVEEACVMPCDPTCERCYGSPTKCSQCTAAVVVEEGGQETLNCLSKCPNNKTPNPDDRNICECTNVLNYDLKTVEGTLESELAHLVEEAEEIEKVIKRVAHCAAECTEDHFQPHRHSKICYACGLAFCSACHDGTDGGHAECTRCLPGSLLYHKEGECLTGHRGEVLEVAEEQEEEAQREEEEIIKSRINLAISLPIVCVFVIVFFLFMSFVAHKRYPHIGIKGEKRHRRQRHDTVTEPPSIHEQVFRARPTVRLR